MSAAWDKYIRADHLALLHENIQPIRGHLENAGKVRERVQLLSLFCVHIIDYLSNFSMAYFRFPLCAGPKKIALTDWPHTSTRSIQDIRVLCLDRTAPPRSSRRVGGAQSRTD